ncbi:MULTISPECIES: hypothetical protein [Saccharibacillus]|uniref:hypothetical protein n=1 Tax=Saccharibacillus TaxID=456492 RepID=UPI0012395267|nr:hypothetical protein [Saccharibacillus sp. WB 17]MWJ31370.1 hypothetical protein [Saccharibacillus sp. WB 17]
MASSSMIASLLLMTSFSPANATDEFGNSAKIFEYEGREYTEIPIDAGSPPTDVRIQAQTELSLTNTDLIDDRVEVDKYLEEEHNDVYAGSYTNDIGENIILIKGASKKIENQITLQSNLPERLEVKQVDYSKEELQVSKELLATHAIELNLAAVGINEKLNRVNVYVSKESDREGVKNIIDENMINWIDSGEIAIDDHAYNLYPGEQIDSPSPTINACSLGFNGRANKTDVGVTAGHCLNGIWYDKSDGPLSIGSMFNANNSSNTTYDAGYITYSSIVVPSVYLNGSSLTIGTTDYAGYYRGIGDSVRIHALHGNGQSYAPVKVLDTSFTIAGQPYDLVATEVPREAQYGDSGGLVYSLANNGKKNYARVEGIFKGTATDANGYPIYGLFSKYSHVYNGLGMSGVYTDTTF